MKIWLLLLCLLTTPAWAQQNAIVNYKSDATHATQVSPTNPLPVTSNAAVPATMVPTAFQSTSAGTVLKGSAGTMVGFQANNFNTTNGLTVMLLDGTAVPTTGATIAACTGLSNQTNPCVMKEWGIPIAPTSTEPGTLGVTWNPGPYITAFNGFVVLCSSTGPLTYTAAANCTFTGEVQ